MEENEENVKIEKNISIKAVEQMFESVINTISSDASQELVNQFIGSTVSTLWNKFMSNLRTIMETAVNEAPINIHNGSAKKPYQVSVPFDVKGVTDFFIEGLDGTGLNYTKAPDKKSFSIAGTPTKSGQIDLKLRYAFDGCHKEDLPFRTLNFFINPDPRDLWKNIPVDWEHMPQPRYEKENTQKEYVKVPSLPDGTPQMDIVGASKRGRSHAQEGKPRDDDFRLYYDDKSNWYVITVADGAGSAIYSREGSRIACETAVAHCKSMLNTPKDFEEAISQYNTSINSNEIEARKNVGDFVYKILGAAALKAHKAINETAKIQLEPVKKYATTFLLAIAKKFDFGWFVASYWVGDGAICLYDKESHSAKLMGIPDEGEYAGQTRFLTMPEIFKDGKAIYDRLRFCIVPDFTALFLMTDGVSDPMFETDANLNNVKKWDALWNNLLHDKEHPVNLVDDNDKAADELLDWLDFWSPGNHDDRTIAILYKGEPVELPISTADSKEESAREEKIEEDDDIMAEATSSKEDENRNDSNDDVVVMSNPGDNASDSENTSGEKTCERSLDRNIPVQ